MKRQPPSMFDGKDLLEARTARDQAIEQVAENRSEWMEKFISAIRTVAAKRLPFTSDDVLAAFPELEECPEKRVIGPALMALCRDEHIEPLGYVNSARSTSHARPKRQWILRGSAMNRDDPELFRVLREASRIPPTS